MMSNSLADLFSRVGLQDEDSMGLLKLLQQRGVAPSVSWNPNLPMQYMGSYVPSKNVMEFDPAVPPSRSTLRHETQHALDEQIRRSKPWMGSDQLSTAYTKMQQPTKLRTFYKEDDRASPEEYRAYGVANTLYPEETKRRERAHVDTTAATEAAILRELFSRKK